MLPVIALSAVDRGAGALPVYGAGILLIGAAETAAAHGVMAA